MRISMTRPRRFVAGFGIVIPDEGFSVFGALIRPSAIRPARQQQQRTASKKESRIHNFFQEQPIASNES
jgi:hypothetical protein